jgi:hypothetical protein
MKLRALSLLLLGAAAAVPAAAQRRAEPVARLQAGPAPSAAPALAPEASRGKGRASAGRAAVSMLGGALIGAGAGFLTSQVAWSDWDKSSNSEFKSRRLGFTLGGSALGALTGLVLGRGTGGTDAYQGRVAPPPASRASVITEEEVRASTATNLYQLVQALRPLWLRRDGRGGQTNSDKPDDPSVAISAVAGGVKVYVERGVVGDIFALRQIAVTDVTSLEFLDAAAATYRLGPGNPAGAIIVHTGRQR